MLALCLMLLGTYYAQNYASIIGRSLSIGIHYLNAATVKVFLSNHGGFPSDNIAIATFGAAYYIRTYIPHLELHELKVYNAKVKK